jgi:5-methylcytosine-specific restriction endonuclease McrA
VPDPNQCHHIHPKFLGGRNDINNGVPLSPPDHDKFTAWWRSTIYTQPFNADAEDPTCA